MLTLKQGTIVFLTLRSTSFSTTSNYFFTTETITEIDINVNCLIIPFSILKLYSAS